jgi:hypothetical protein
VPAVGTADAGSAADGNAAGCLDVIVGGASLDGVAGVRSAGVAWLGVVDSWSVKARMAQVGLRGGVDRALGMVVAGVGAGGSVCVAARCRDAGWRGEGGSGLAMAKLIDVEQLVTSPERPEARSLEAPIGWHLHSSVAACCRKRWTSTKSSVAWLADGGLVRQTPVAVALVGEGDHHGGSESRPGVARR